LLPLVLWLGLAGGAAQAADVDIRNAVLAPAEDGSLVLSADIRFDLGARLEEAVMRGVPLYFVLELEITSPRWYWFDKVLSSRERVLRLSYHALTRQFRVSSGPLHQNFGSLEEALGVIRRVSHWLAVDRGVLEPGENYEAALRFALDLSQLPKPFQVNAIASRDWTLDSDWQRWGFFVTGAPR
jgi:hypothetical protein